MEIHEAANIYPLERSSIPALAENIREQGLLNPIKLFQGKILDGRRRFKACELAGVVPTFIDVTPEDPVAYVLSEHDYRRKTLKGSQRAMVAAKSIECYEIEAKRRMSEGGGDKKSPQAKSGCDLGRTPIKGRASHFAGKSVEVCSRSVERASKVLKYGVPEVVEAVTEGHMSVKYAETLVTQPEEVQRDEATKAATRSNQKPKPKDKPAVKKTEEPEPGKLQGVGVFHANEAINCLIRIPKNDALRKRGFQIVTDWIKRHQ